MLLKKRGKMGESHTGMRTDIKCNEKVQNQVQESVSHTFPPVYDAESKILILGSFPSVKSREMNFYYGHPQNRFWKVLAHILGVDVPQTVAEKKEMLLMHKVAVWDVIESCTITGSSDTSIRNVVVNDFTEILANSAIETIYVNGTKAYELYHKYAEKKTGRQAVKLPSTSPANAAWSLERLCKEWGEKLGYGCNNEGNEKEK